MPAEEGKEVRAGEHSGKLVRRVNNAAAPVAIVAAAMLHRPTLTNPRSVDLSGWISGDSSCSPDASAAIQADSCGAMRHSCVRCKNNIGSVIIFG